MSLGDAARDGQADAEAAGLGAAGGDGIDSNGDLNVSGGEIYVSGPTSDGDSTLDYDGAATVTGGTIVAAGTAAWRRTSARTPRRAAPH